MAMWEKVLWALAALALVVEFGPAVVYGVGYVEGYVPSFVRGYLLGRKSD